MRAQLSHLLFNVQPANTSFYKELLTFLGWKRIYDDEGMLGMADQDHVSLWFGNQVKAAGNDYDGPGMNHLALGAESQADVDALAGYLQERNVELLFQTPRHRAEFSESPDHTYYQIMFESPDRILLEFVYTGPKSM